VTPPASTYREHAPAPALAPHLVCVWSQVIGPAEGPHRHRVLPDGCADLVWIGSAAPIVAGPATRPALVALAPRTVLIGVRLRPGAVPRVLGLPACELADRDTPLADLWRGDCTQASAAPSLAVGLAAAQSALLARLADAGPPDPLVGAATAWLARRPAGRIEALAALLEIGERQLRRRFAAAVGYGPKTFQRVLRLQRVLALAGQGPRRDVPLAGLAAAAGYADQAHMSREVQALTGRSPGALLRHAASTLALSDLFKTGAGPSA
jgi:AraC-like DNA-binding protein